MLCDDCLHADICENITQGNCDWYLSEKKLKDKWIPVSERLPKENGEYLVTREAYIDIESRDMVFIIDIASFTINHGLNNGFHKANTVIAWQPLPEPYIVGIIDNTPTVCGNNPK